MTTVAAALDALTERFSLSPVAVDGYRRYLDLLATDPTAPTSVTDPAAGVITHLADSLVLLEVHPPAEGSVVVDVGSGAGAPGLPLALARPDLDVTLLDSLERKTAFLQHAVDVTGATNATVVTARAEAWPEGRDRHDAVWFRAVAALPVLMEYAAPLLRVGGTLVAWKGAMDATEAADGQAAAERLGMEITEQVSVSPWPQAHHRQLVFATKVAETPSTFPRRPGMARKRPLTAR